MAGEVLLVLLQDGEQFLQFLVVDGVDVAGGLVEVAGQAGGVVGEEGAGAGDFGVDLGGVYVSWLVWRVGMVGGRGRAYAEEFAVG